MKFTFADELWSSLPLMNNIVNGQWKYTPSNLLPRFRDLTIVRYMAAGNGRMRVREEMGTMWKNVYRAFTAQLLEEIRPFVSLRRTTMSNLPITAGFFKKIDDIEFNIQHLLLCKNEWKRLNIICHVIANILDSWLKSTHLRHIVINDIDSDCIHDLYAFTKFVINSSKFIYSHENSKVSGLLHEMLKGFHRSLRSETMEEHLLMIDRYELDILCHMVALFITYRYFFFAILRNDQVDRIRQSNDSDIIYEILKKSSGLLSDNVADHPHVLVQYLKEIKHPTSDHLNFIFGYIYESVLNSFSTFELCVFRTLFANIPKEISDNTYEFPNENYAIIHPNGFFNRSTLNRLSFYDLKTVENKKNYQILSVTMKFTTTRTQETNFSAYRFNRKDEFNLEPATIIGNFWLLGNWLEIDSLRLWLCEEFVCDFQQFFSFLLITRRYNLELFSDLYLTKLVQFFVQIIHQLHVALNSSCGSLSLRSFVITAQGQLKLWNMTFFQPGADITETDEMTEVDPTSVYSFLLNNQHYISPERALKLAGNISGETTPEDDWWHCGDVVLCIFIYRYMMTKLQGELPLTDLELREEINDFRIIRYNLFRLIYDSLLGFSDQDQIAIYLTENFYHLFEGAHDELFDLVKNNFLSLDPMQRSDENFISNEYLSLSQLPQINLGRELTFILPNFDKDTFDGVVNPVDMDDDYDTEMEEPLPIRPDMTQKYRVPRKALVNLAQTLHRLNSEVV
ncbi:hypothetical protein SNEBB_002479 [Seison nebaliae]|nr:hypothetical protein SNEBB_002479 [Seison nebaliae]